MEYRVVYCDSVEQLTYRVQKWIEQGWVPQGGVAEYIGGLCQAMVRETDVVERRMS